jgi:hypothetical protein
MDKNKLEMLAGILGGMGMIWYASKGHSGSMSTMTWHFLTAQELLNRTNGDAQDAVVLAQQEYGNDPEYCQLVKAAIFHLAGQQGSAFRQQNRDGEVIDRTRVNNVNIDLGRRQEITPADRTNRQRYKIFWDCVTRYAEPNWRASNVVAEDGGYYGALLRNEFMCFHNDGDSKWADCVIAAQTGVTRELGVISFNDLMQNGNVTGFECVLAAMPVDANGNILPFRQGIALRKHTVVAAYADEITALRNWGQAAALIQRACAGSTDIEDLDDYMRR